MEVFGKSMQRAPQNGAPAGQVTGTLTFLSASPLLIEGLPGSLGCQCPKWSAEPALLVGGASGHMRLCMG